MGFPSLQLYRHLANFTIRFDRFTRVVDSRLDHPDIVRGMDDGPSNSYSHGVISPSVYIGGKYDNTWDYYDHRQIVKKLVQTDSECIFISNINVFTFYYLTPKEQRHRVKLLWSLESVSSGSTPEKIRLYKQITYKGPMLKSALFVFYDNDKDYLDTFSKQRFFPMTTIDNNISFPGFRIFRFK